MDKREFKTMQFKKGTKRNDIVQALRKFNPLRITEDQHEYETWFL